MNDLNNQCREWLKKVNSQIHGTTHEIPYQRLKDEKLNPLTSVPAYITRQENTRKISRDCYVSYKGNRYSVPWKFAGRECRVIEESSSIRIEVDSIAIADHSILSGSGRISKKKEHFEGLLKAIREENAAVFSQVVETRDLKRYEDVI